MRNKLKNWVCKILTILVFLMPFSAFSQISDSQNKPGEKSEISENDPIVAMLDSLVTQHFLIKSNALNCNLSNNYCFGTNEIPSYPEEIYQKRLSQLQSPIPLVYNESVRNYIDLYANRKKELTARVLGLSQMYFPMFEQILDQQGLPLEFKYLAVVESALNPTAVSKAGATGIWQFMFNTAKMYSLDINSFIDERKDPYKATYAACEYFKNMYAIYKDWLLVIAAYNCGPGNVNKAIARSGGKRSFWEISKYLPSETRGYVPAFIAVNYVMNYAAEHNINVVPTSISYFETDTVKINKPLSFEFLAGQLDIPLSVLEYLNPSYRRNIIPATGETFNIRLPYNKTSLFASNADFIMRKFAEETSSEDLLPKSLAANEAQYISREIKQIHNVKRGEKMSSIDKRYSCSISEIKQWNKIRNNKVSPGQKLIVFVTVKKKIVPVNIPTPAVMAKNTPTTPDVAAADSLNNETLTTNKNQEKPAIASALPPAKLTYVYHIVQKGDTLWRIANKYKYEGVTVEQLKQLNKINSSRELRPGTKLKVVIAG
jgi:membrane-bound lytic murein transglycosylase D